MFHEPIEEYHAFKRQGDSRESLIRERAVWIEKFIEQLRSDRCDTLIMSAEDISGPYGDATARLGDFLSRFTSDVKVYAYVRPPISFMQSAFQQRVVGGGYDRLNPLSLWPFYRERFEKLDNVFGRENVQLRKFDTRTLLQGDVVLDFLAALDIAPTGQYERLRGNESLSLEALSLVFLQRKLGDGITAGYPGAHQGNARFVHLLRAIGDSRVVFSGDLVNPVISRNRADLEWIEDRLGEPLLDVPQPYDKAISSEADLLAIAQGCRKELDDVLCRAVRLTPRGEDEVAIDRLAHKLDVLRQLVA